MPDYDKLIDAETWAFIHETGRLSPTFAAPPSVAEQRASYDTMAAAFRKPRPAGVAVEDRTVAGVPCRIYTAGATAVTLAYYHGGGFVVGGLDSHDDVCAELCAATGFRVVSADYRLAPEHLHPAAYDDALAVARALLAESATGRLILAGDSAGGNLAAAVALSLRNTDRLAGLLMIYPGLGGDTERGSYLTHAEAPMLTRADVLYYHGVRHKDGEEPPDDWTAAPLWSPSFAGLPPTVAFAAECDPLADDARAFCALVEAEGGKAQRVLEPGLVHGYLRARHSVGRARDSFARITAAAKALGDGRWPAVA